MKITKTAFDDVFIIEPKQFIDGRGCFLETYNTEKYKEIIGNINFIQDNESVSKKGVIRGLHYQKPPFTQSKLVRVINGSVLDIIVDIKIDSPNFGKYITIELSSKNKLQVFIPRGYAHGFISLENDTIFNYKVDNLYDKDSECGIIYNDEYLNIDWFLDSKNITISEKDIMLDTFKNNKFYSKSEYLKNK